MTDTQHNRGDEIARSLHDGKVIIAVTSADLGKLTNAKVPFSVYSPTTHILDTGIDWPLVKDGAKTPYVSTIEPKSLTRKRSSDWSWIEPIAVTSVESSMLVDPKDQLADLKKQITKNYRRLQATDRSVRKAQKAMRKVLKARLTELQKTAPKPPATEAAKVMRAAPLSTDRLQFR